MLDFQFNAPSGPIWVLCVVAVAIAISPFVAARLHVPDILALLAAGFLIGPHALGVVDADDTIVAALGQLGLLYLMFLAGAELDFDVIQRHRRGVAGLSLLTFSIPMLLGVGIGWLFGYTTAAALLIGSLWASHTLLTYPTVRAAGLTSRPSVATTVGATVVTDTLSLAVLAGVAGYATGSQSGVALGEQIVIGLLLLGVWSTLILPSLTQFFYRRVSYQPTVRYVFVLAALLSTAVLAQVVGVEGIVGAFFAGLGLNRMLPAHSRIFERAEFLGAALLIPLFLISVGLIIDPSVMAAPATLVLAAGFMVASFGGKGLAALACRWFFAFSWSDVGVVFGLTCASAAATLAATFVGFEVGLIGTTVVNAVLIVILASVVLSSLTTEFFARRLHSQTSETEKLGSAVVLLVASMDTAAPAIDVAARLAAADGGVVLPRLVCVGDKAIGEPERTELEHLVARRGLDAETFVRHAVTLPDLLVRTCQDEQATAVVVAEPADTFVTGQVHDGVQELLGTSPVALFLVAARQPLRSLRLVGEGAVLDGLRRTGLVTDASMRSPGFAALFRYPKPSAPPDGACVLVSATDPLRLPEDTRIVVVSQHALE